ncbi:hypothetical protein JOF57_005103 [Mycolicibacterium lutetiense]|uniref:AAA domain-containing protein n=2 Tax=Mycolicibacterium lutetiense TaxID=1641992 RepID=A0ABS5A0B4_9MYCO|nr:hypothetical protein [Mycolicibacterium lutetiense]
MREPKNGLPNGWIFASEAPPSRPVDWLEENKLARGHVTYLFGEEGIGKSTWWVYVVAKRTRAGEYVVVIITEDGWEDTARPRMEAAGVDLTKVIMLNVAEDADEFEMGIPGPAWLTEQELPPVSLVVIDGLADATAYVNGSLPKATEWRPVITGWKRYAARHHAAVLALGHTNRDTLNGTRGAVGLSGQIRQVVRLNLMALRTEDDRLAIGVEKSNICRTDQPVDLFEITEATSAGISVNICRPCGLGDATAKELFQVLAAQPHVTEGEAERERLDGCLADLIDLLKGRQGNDRWAPTTEITDLLAKGKGTSATRWSQSQIDRARTRAIKENHIETDHPKVPGPHYWRARLRDWD